MAITLCNWVWRLLIAAVFILAAWGKWQQGVPMAFPPETLYERIVAFSPLRHYSIVGLEMGIGLWVLSTVRPRWSSIAAGMMLLAFCALLAIELWSANPSDCGCGIVMITPDGDPRHNIKMALVRNGLLLLGCAWIYLMELPTPARRTIAPEAENG